MKMQFLWAALAVVCSAAADVRLEVLVDHARAVYHCGETAKFSVKAVDASTGAAATGGTIRVRLDNFGEAVVAAERTIDFAKDGCEFSLTGTLREPGFLRVRALPERGTKLTANAGQGEFNWAVAFDPKGIRPGAPCPDDFDAFWAEAIAKYDREVPEDVTLELYPPKCTDRLDFYRLSLTTVGGRKVYGSLVRPKDLTKGPYPLFLQVPGAGPSSIGWGQPGQVTVCMNVHYYEPLDADGKARAARQAEEDRELAKRYGVSRYALAGISESREAYYYYGTILGIRRAFHWASKLPEVKKTAVTYDGTSQGGGFGLIMTAMCPFIAKSTVFVPALTDLLGFKAGNRRSGWPRLVEEQLEANRAAAERWAPYFDGANFAARIRTPIAFEVGFGDNVCPPQCGYAAYNVCPAADKRIYHGIGQGHAVPGEMYGRIAKWRAVPRASGTDRDIQRLVDASVGKEAVLPPGRYEIATTVVLPSHTHLRMADCHLRMKDGAVAPMFRNRADDDGCSRDIVLDGCGSAVLDGGLPNGLDEFTSCKDGRPHVSENLTLFFAQVDGFEVRDLTVRDQRWWALMFLQSTKGRIGGVRFELTRHALDSRAKWRNQDGIDLRVGCRDITIEDISGETGDDLIALTALDAPPFEGRYARSDRPRDIRDITIRRVKGRTNNCALIRLLSHFGQRIERVRISDVVEDSVPGLHNQTQMAIRIGDRIPPYYRHDERNAQRFGDIRDITVDGLVTRALTAVVTDDSVEDLTVRNVRLFGDAGSVWCAGAWGIDISPFIYLPEREGEVASSTLVPALSERWGFPRADTVRVRNVVFENVVLENAPHRGERPFRFRRCAFENCSIRNVRGFGDGEPFEVIDCRSVPALSKADEPEFISVPGGRNAAFETACFVKTVTNAASVAKAVWRTTGLGVYEAFVNGSRSGTDVLKPGFTSRAKCRQVTTEDVTALMKRGKGEVNVLSAWVTAGWWRDKVMATQDRTSAFRGELRLEHADGSVTMVPTDVSWRAAYGGPVTEASIYSGEDYDARTDVAWMKTGRVDWPPAVVNNEFAGELRPMDGARVFAREDLAMAPQKAWIWMGTRKEAVDRFGEAFVRREYKDGDEMELGGYPAISDTLVVDFGQNHAGVPEFEFEAARGVTLTCLPGEMLNDGEGIRSRGSDGPGGSVYRANVCRLGGGRIAEIHYRFAGTGVERYRPRFTFFGYRYLQISADGPVKIRRVRSIPLSSVAKEDETLEIETGNPAVNRLIQNARWGMLSNYLSVPTDCPQRNERLGWTADTQVFSGAGAYLADTYGFMRKWMRDVADSQLADGRIPAVAPQGMGGGAVGRVGWGDAAVIVPYRMWRHFGRKEIVEESWPTMEKYLAWVSSRDYRTMENEGQFADWLSFEEYMTLDLPEKWKEDPETKANVYSYWNYLGGCYWLWDARMMKEMAAAIGKDTGKYLAEEEKALAYVRREFMTDGDLLPFMRKMQTPQLFAMKLGIFPDEVKRKVCRDRLLKNFADNGNRLKTGFLGTSILLETLAEEMDAPEMAYSLLLQHGFPSWLYSVDQGATTIWERWNSYTKEKGFGLVGMNSFNHYAYGAVVEWIASTVAGFRRNPEHPGRFIVRPVKDARLGWVRAKYRTPSGEMITSEWKMP